MAIPVAGSLVNVPIARLFLLQLAVSDAIASISMAKLTHSRVLIRRHLRLLAVATLF